MPELSEHERERLPDHHDEIERISDREFKIHEVNAEQEILWIEDERNYHISFIMSHIDPDSELGNMVQKLPDNDHVTISGVRLQKGGDYMPRWYLTGISNVRNSTGPERNVFDG